jgi:hypothetical protein
MRLLTHVSDCEAALSGLNNSILDSYRYKAILNRYYQPEAYLFFCDGEDLVPLVVKNNLVTFYGGARHNHSNALPENPDLINAMLDYLDKQGHDFRLPSITRDYFSHLSTDHRVFDVPFEPEWHLRGVQNYDQEVLLASVSKKKRWLYKRVLENMSNYEFETVSYEAFKSNYSNVMDAHFSYFSQRGKLSAWHDMEHLLEEILDCFAMHENLLIRQVRRDEEILAIYTIAYNSNEMIYYFGGSLQKEDNLVSRAMYFDILDTSKRLASQLNVSSLNALRGSFGIKKNFGFKPIPLYALIKDDNWAVRWDVDVSRQQYDEIYGRKFGVERYS